MSPIKVLGAAWSAGALLFIGSLIGIFVRKVKELA